MTKRAVKSADIANGKVTSLDIQNNQVRSPDIFADAVGSSEVADNSLGGADINESTLNGLGAADGFDNFCDPSTTTFLDCDAAATVSLSRTMNVLVIATSHFDVFTNPPAKGNCRLERNGVAVSNNHPIGSLVQDTNSATEQGGMNLVDVQSLSAGTYTFEVACNQLDADIEFRDIRVAAVELSQE